MKKILVVSLISTSVFLLVSSATHAETTTDPNETVEATPIQRVDTDALDEPVTGDSDLYILDEPIDGANPNMEPLLLDDHNLEDLDQGQPMLDAEVQELLEDENVTADSGRMKLFGVDAMQFVVLIVVIIGIWGIFKFKNRGSS